MPQKCDATTEVMTTICFSQFKRAEINFNYCKEPVALINIIR